MQMAARPLYDPTASPIPLPGMSVPKTTCCMGGETFYAGLCAAQLAVLQLAASGWLGGRH